LALLVEFTYFMTLALLRDFSKLPAHLKGGVVTIGHFDGVHIGHQYLLAEVVAHANALGVPAIAVTFEPHAYEYFAKDSTSIARLTRFREKYLALKASKVDYIIILRFNAKLAALSADKFITDLFYPALCPHTILIGDDFRFGAKRLGDITLLKAMARQLNFNVIVPDTYLWQGLRVSSTRVREALALGHHQLANALLGRPYSMQGHVIYGMQLGRKLGYPTANIAVKRRCIAVQGIYTVMVYGLAEQPLPAVASIGIRPALGGKKPLLEVYLLDFDLDIYGALLTVEFCAKLRDEMHFPDLASLQQQIADDVMLARRYFEQGKI
jgi:riboflavin kinase / FMN adenylyltransferase